MSTSATNPNKLYKKSFHWRKDSGELHVFEAARYFSIGGDPAYINGVRGEKQQAARRSLDVPIMMRSNQVPQEYNHHHHNILDQKQTMKDENKKFKQPSSPGGRLASFLNSLFNQTSLKKKKKSKSGKESEEESHNGNGRRRRRSSISHFRITTTSKTAAADKGSGFTTPPHANTPIKSYKELARYADHRRSEKICDNIVGKDRPSEKRELHGEDDGGESDSSSDLFDLPNHDLDFFSSGLPVYETTHIQRITIPTST